MEFSYTNQEWFNYVLKYDETIVASRNANSVYIVSGSERSENFPA